jgi:hypothetical protein
MHVTYTATPRDGSAIPVLYTIYVTEHQTLSRLTEDGSGTSGGTLRNYFDDHVAQPSWAGRASSDQTFTMSFGQGQNRAPSAPMRVIMDGKEGSGIHIDLGGSPPVQERLIP